MKLPAYMFDLDGTIIDSIHYAVEIYNTVLKKYNLPEITSDKYRQIVDPSFNVIAKRLGLEKEEHLRDIINLWNDGIANNHSSIRLYPGMGTLLEKLYNEGHTLILLTRNYRESALNNLERFGIKKYFENDKIIAHGDVKHLKPHEEQFLYGLKKIGTDAKEVVLIEDMNESIHTAKRIGMITVAVTWGYETMEMLRSAEPDYIVNDIGELEKVIDEINLSFSKQ